MNDEDCIMEKGTMTNIDEPKASSNEPLTEEERTVLRGLMMEHASHQRISYEEMLENSFVAAARAVDSLRDRVEALEAGLTEAIGLLREAHEPPMKGNEDLQTEWDRLVTQRLPILTALLDSPQDDDHSQGD